ncbi:unnamed protein product [Leptidea sinapis]|uniref:RNA polymerase II-associated protein 1 C-terminal domain-containing protein n=1 Tax=Leptidea sinapis TaxID=189913 RepID=A0A5E4Q0Z2_9NEOP|nr:unnamed protein product [Leptidea sinapis]
MLRRPKPGDDEFEILRMQEEYLLEKGKNQNLQPAAQVINLRKAEHQTTKRCSPGTSTDRKPSKYAQTKGLSNNLHKRVKFDENISIVGDILEKNIDESNAKKIPESMDDNIYFPKIIPSVLGDIVEKTSDIQVELDFKQMPSQGFPVVTNQKDFSVKRNASTSITQEKMNVDEPPGNEMDSTNLHNNLPNQSYIVSTDDANAIHKDNIDILSKMSEKDILNEQHKLLNSLDPKLIEFIKSKRSAMSKGKEGIIRTPINSDEKENSMDITEESLADDILWDNDVLSHPHINKWLNFDKLERDKLDWMQGLQEHGIKPDEPYEARFNFQGYLLPYSIEYTEKTKTLFHHGEEPHRPGYTLNELFELSRSTIIQQRVMSLNAIAGILEYENAGIYKEIIEIPLSKIFFLIRIAMDENKLIILEPALKGMRNLLYNRLDEASLDALIGFRDAAYQPCLENDKSEIAETEYKESEIKDFHLAEIDIVAATLRTSILQRIYYILNHVKPSFNCVQYSLQILIRLVRNSLETAKEIIGTEHLMNAILVYFVPNTGINFCFEHGIVYNGKPVLSALKLIRILSLQSRDLSQTLVEKYNILKPLSTYLCSEVDGTYGLRLQIEAYSIFTNIMKFQLGMEEAMSICPIIVMALYKHVQGTSIFINSSILSATHAAVLLQFVNNFLLSGLNNLDYYKQQLYPLLTEGMHKWFTQTAQLDAFTCGHLRLVSSLFNCFETIITTDKLFIKELQESLLNLGKSAGIRIIMQSLTSNSNLLSGIEDTDIHNIKNLVTLGSCSSLKERVLPILNPGSPIPFLDSLFQLLNVIDNKNLAMFYLEQTLPYMQRISNTSPYLMNNWFTRMETDMIFNIIKLSSSLDIPETLKDLLYAVASKLCYILRIDKQMELEFLFDSIIFNKTWFTAQRLFNLVSLSEADGFSVALNNIEDIKACYRSVSLKFVDTGSIIILHKWQEPILPRDWIYLPILSLYSKSQENVAPKVVGDHANKIHLQIAGEREIIIKSSLEWILFNELCFPDLLKDIDVTDRFCRILCVFLCDNSLFLNKKIKMLLEKCVQILFKMGSKFDFDKELVGLHNFQDFYTQILEQFQSVSYGDDTFAACVLVPVAQKHNIKWRKLMWSEYAGCLRALDCPENQLCYGINDYLYPEELDESLLKSYHRALTCNLLREGTIAYKIAQHHVESFKLRIKR